MINIVYQNVGESNMPPNSVNDGPLKIVITVQRFDPANFTNAPGGRYVSVSA